MTREYEQLTERVRDLASALAALIARVRQSGGYASPEEQDVLRQAEQALAGGEPGPQTAGEAEKPPGVPQERAERHKINAAAAMNDAARYYGGCGTTPCCVKDQDGRYECTRGAGHLGLHSDGQRVWRRS